MIVATGDAARAQLERRLDDDAIAVAAAVLAVEALDRDTSRTRVSTIRRLAA